MPPSTERPVTPAPAGLLAGKLALVTGATSGIGRGIALEFAVQGARVVISGRNAERGQETIRLAEERGVAAAQLHFVPADLSDAASCRRLMAAAGDWLGGLDVLVNDAGDVSRGTLEDLSLEQWDRQMAVNLRAPFLLMQGAVPLMRRRGGGSIINIGSVNAYIGETKLLAYSASKGGLMTLTRNSAALLAADHIRVNCLNVGWTLTEGEMRTMAADTGSADWLEGAAAKRPFGRLLTPADVAQAALFFATEQSSLITGAVLDVEQNAVGTPGLVFL